MHVQAADPAAYSLILVDGGNEQLLPLADVIGRHIEIRFLEKISCVHCGRVTKKSYNQGYCYPCFRKLASCDLCVMSPARCHFAEGTCREPDWGERFCMQPHWVYLANSSGIKVGITRQGHEVGRWLDQGAVQALPILSAATRMGAGLAEVAIARHISDRTDWRALVRGDAPPVDLLAARADAAQAMPALPAGVEWAGDDRVRSFHFPILRYGAAVRLKFAAGHQVAGTLLGVKGQFLLFEEGVFNVRQHTAHHVEVRVSDAVGAPPQQQTELFT